MTPKTDQQNKQFYYRYGISYYPAIIPPATRRIFLRLSPQQKQCSPRKIHLNMWFRPQSYDDGAYHILLAMWYKISYVKKKRICFYWNMQYFL